MTSWKTRWQNELDRLLPALRQDVKDAPLPYKTIEEKPSFKDWLATHKKRFIATIATGMATVVALAVGLPIALSSPDSLTAVAPSAYLVEINPRAVFTVDTAGKISAVIAVNSDADMIVSDQTRRSEIIGKTPEEGIQVFVDYAARLGYLDFGGGSAVRISGCNAKEKLAAVVAALEGYLRSKGAYTAVIQEQVAADDFCERAGLPIAYTYKDLTASLGELPYLYTDRITGDNEQAETWQDAYQEVVGEKLEATIEQTIEQYVPSILEYLDLPDYVDTYEELYDYIAQEYPTTEAVVALFNAVGLDTALLEELSTNPQTLEEYKQKLENYFAEEYADRTEENLAGYEQPRAEISQGDYAAYIQSIIDAYGSLQAYWESMQKE